MKTIAFTNQKGGIGKTTMAANLGATLADMGHKVVLVDIDPQGNLTVSYGVRAHELDNTIYEVLKKQSTISNVLLQVVRPGDGLYLVPASLALSAAETELSAKPGREYLLLKKPCRNLTTAAILYSLTALRPLAC